MGNESRGLAAVLGAFLIWGLSPAFWKLLLAVPAVQLLAHRVLWAAVLLFVFSLSRGRISRAKEVVGSSKAALTLALTTLLISVNWLTYIWAVLTDRVLHASLGYYINPLVTVLLAMIFLGERLSKVQWLSIGCAAVAVLVLLQGRNDVPWIALVLAFSFGLYALLRKKVSAEADTGLLLETGLLSPFAFAFLAYCERSGTAAFGHRGLGIDLLLIASGIITALPLLLFTYGARRLPLATAGFLQFSAPTLQFLLAVFVFREPFSRTHLVAFAWIWAGLTLFTWDLRHRWRAPFAQGRRRPESLG